MKACRYKKIENGTAAFRTGLTATLILGLVISWAGLPHTGPARVEAAERPVMTQEELDKTDCSITVMMTADDPEAGVIPLGGGKLELFRLAGVKVDNGFRFVYDGSFAGLAGKPEYKTEDDEDLTVDLAQLLEEYADANKIAGNIKDIPEGGSVEYTGLTPGLYLVRQKEPAPNYAPAATFLVTIPLYDRDANVNLFNVDAFPKATPAKRLGPCTADPPIQKKFKINGTPSETVFLFRFERKNSTYPMPVNTDGSQVSKSGNEMILRIDADTPDADGNLTGKAEAGDITFREIGDYYYLLSEIDTGIEGVTYDPAVFWFKYEIRAVKGSDTLKCTRILVKSGNEDGPVLWDGDKNPDAFVFEFHNEFKKQEDPTDPTEPSKEDPTDPTDPARPTSDHRDGGEGRDRGRTPSYPSEGSIPISYEPEAPEVAGIERLDILDDAGGRQSGLGGKMRLPQAGQLWWPVPLLSVLGMALILGGVRTLIKGKKE